MGVTKLWEILSDSRVNVTLDEIKGLTLAVDLATWICESEGVKPMKSYVTRPYLRNLFFRVSSILKAGVNLVFVLDGKAPELKLETIAKRLAASGGSPKKTSSGIRSRLNAKLKECCVLLDSLGVPWIKAESEGEALCAALNKIGLVDGVVTSDGDAFLYGARTVYRNFSVEKNAVIERYCMETVEVKLNLNQRDLIALGLLLGCDYCPKGVPGVGVTQAVKLLTSFGSRDSLEVFSTWRETGELVNTCDNLKKSIHCSSCGHEGSKKVHFDTGCRSCGCACRETISNSKKTVKSISCRCRWHNDEDKRKNHALEYKIKTVALKDSKFPDEAIVVEFSKNQRYICPTTANAIEPSDNEKLRARFKIKSPTMEIACEYLRQKLDWELSYALNKVLPLVTRYLLHNSYKKRNSEIDMHSIVKTRVKDHVQSLEVRWMATKGLEMVWGDNELLTIEPEGTVKNAFPKLVAVFYTRIEREKDEMKKVKARQKKLKGSTKEESASMQCKKMTDFFKVKKERTDIRPPAAQDGTSKVETPDIVDITDLEGQAELKDLESIMKSISIGKAGSERVKSLKSNPEKQTAGTKELTRKTNQEKLPQKLLKKSLVKEARAPVIVFSSDSEESDTEFDNVVGKMGDTSLNGKDSIVEEISKPDVGILIPSPFVEKTSSSGVVAGDEVTFSHELNFSLGCSLLHATVADESKENCSPQCGAARENASRHLSEFPDTGLAINKFSVADVDSNMSEKHGMQLFKESFNTPDKTMESSGRVEVSDSPVFMTLMERLKSRQMK